MAQKSEHLINNNLDTHENPAIVSSHQAISYMQLYNAIQSCQAHLKKAGINAEDRVGIINPMSMEYIVALLSLWSIKAVACPFNRGLPESALKNQLQLLNCRHILTSNRKIKAVSTKQYDLNNISRIPNLKKVQHYKKNTEYDFSFPLEQKATILWTSGSGSNPKPVLHTLGNHIFNAKGSNELIPVAPGDYWLLSLPLYHVSGLSILFRVLREGGTIVVPEAHENIQHAMEHYPVTHISLVPAQLARLCADDKIMMKLRNCKVILIGGSRIPDGLLQKSSKNKLPVYTTYGLTEMASQVATAKYPMPARILNGRSVKISGDGEILVKGKTLFQGYINGNTMDLPLTEEGWFATGDLGYLKDDGSLIVTGRKDNMFISGGENIQPEEIEQYLCQWKSIEQAVVVAIQDDVFGSRPIAFIKMTEGKSLHRDELYHFLENYLPKFKIPDWFYVWPDHFDSNSFKINRQNFAALALEKNSSIRQIH